MTITIPAFWCGVIVTVVVECVSPLSTIEKAVINAIGKIGAFGGNIGGTPVNLTLQVALDGQVIGQKMVDWGKLQQMATGVNPYGLGTT